MSKIVSCLFNQPLLVNDCVSPTWRFGDPSPCLLSRLQGQKPAMYGQASKVVQVVHVGDSASYFAGELPNEGETGPLPRQNIADFDFNDEIRNNV